MVVCMGAKMWVLRAYEFAGACACVCVCEDDLQTHTQYMQVVYAQASAYYYTMHVSADGHVCMHARMYASQRIAKYSCTACIAGIACNACGVCNGRNAWHPRNARNVCMSCDVMWRDVPPCDGM